MGEFFITAEQVWSSLSSDAAPRLLDVRRRTVFEADERLIAGARWCDHAHAAELAATMASGRGIVVYCAHGQQLSQLAVAAMRAAGLDARVISGGVEAWDAAGLPMLRRSGLPELSFDGPTVWVTRRRPKIDRIACPWLILRFIDPDARFLFVEPDQVLATAEEIGAVAFDVEGAAYTHAGARCSFDMLLERSGIADPALADMAVIIRGADTGRLDLAAEAAGLLAVSVGISARAGDDDQAALRMGLAVYDALYAWCRKAPSETHGWPPRAAA